MRVILTLCLVYLVTNKIATASQTFEATEISDDPLATIRDYTISGKGMGQTFKKLAYLTDIFGNRYVGGPNFAKAQSFLMSQLQYLVGRQNVRLETVTGIARWNRGDPRDNFAQLVSPHPKQIGVLAFGYSRGGNFPMVQAIVVRSFDELNKLNVSQVAGKIVVFNEPWLGSYGATVAYRSQGAAKAAEKGAVAALVRSVTPFSLYTLHTGMMGSASIPGAAITIEDAELLQRIQDKGLPIVMNLQLTCGVNGTLNSSNLVAEIRGTEKPDEVVLFGGHLDSWDVGEGAMDDGGGVAVTWQMLETLTSLNLKPKRTLRAVFWTAEELGYVGGDAYYQAHRAESPKMSMVMESDSGTFKPNGFNFYGSAAAKQVLQGIMNVLQPFNATKLTDGDGPGDPSGFVNDGVPGVELDTHMDSGNSVYFYYHHTEADTMTMMNSTNLDLCASVYAVAAFGVANLDNMLPRN